MHTLEMGLVTSLADMVNSHLACTSLGVQSRFKPAAEHCAAGGCLVKGEHVRAIKQRNHPVCYQTRGKML